MEALLIVFFFQAEDGIRDTSVTGVQTCALPISDARVVRGGTPAGSAQPLQAQSKAMKPAAQKTPAAAGTAVPPKNAAAPKGAAAHTESAKPGKPDNRKDAKGHEDGKQKHEGQ